MIPGDGVPAVTERIDRDERVDVAARIVFRLRDESVRAAHLGCQPGEHRVLPLDHGLVAQRVHDPPRRPEPVQPERTRIGHIHAWAVHAGVRRRRVDGRGKADGFDRSEALHDRGLPRPERQAVRSEFARGIEGVERGVAPLVSPGDDPVREARVVAEAHAERVGVSNRGDLAADDRDRCDPGLNAGRRGCDARQRGRAVRGGRVGEGVHAARRVGRQHDPAQSTAVVVAELRSLPETVDGCDVFPGRCAEVHANTMRRHANVVGTRAVQRIEARGVRGSVEIRCDRGVHTNRTVAADHELSPVGDPPELFKARKPPARTEGAAAAVYNDDLRIHRRWLAGSGVRIPVTDLKGVGVDAGRVVQCIEAERDAPSLAGRPLVAQPLRAGTRHPADGQGPGHTVRDRRS